MSKTEVRGYREAVESAQVRADRWVTIMRVAEAWDPKGAREEVINVTAMEPNAVPQISAELTSGKNDNAGNYSLERVPPEVKIGMVRGGRYEPVAGFGWRDAGHKQAHGG